MAQEYVLSLDDQRATLETVGGKGASLARLLQASMLVPGGFHVTTAAYERFVAENDLKSGIGAALEKADASKPDTLTNTSEKIGDVFLRADLPEGVSGAISEAYAGLGRLYACVGCGSNLSRRKLTELHEGNHDNLTYFHGDMLCASCADRPASSTRHEDAT